MCEREEEGGREGEKREGERGGEGGVVRGSEGKYYGEVEKMGKIYRRKNMI